MTTALIEFTEARERILEAATPIETKDLVPLEAARGRVLAHAQCAPIDIPPADVSAMDGYAVATRDFENATLPLEMPISQRIPAGQVGVPLAAGTAARIFTGAHLPPQADAVVMQERCEHEHNSVRILHRPAAFEWVRRRGEDVSRDEEILAVGCVLDARHLALAASVGIAHLPVRTRLRVALLATGDELVAPGTPLLPGQVYDSNQHLLRALLESMGCEVSGAPVVRDTAAGTIAALEAAARDHHLIITIGGVSVGEEDHVKHAIESIGELSMWRIAMKPGKPLALGRIGQARVVGLPGNPVSAFVTFMMLVRPMIRRMQGAAEQGDAVLEVAAGFDWPRPDPRREFLRARLDENGCAVIHPHQGSAALPSVVWASGLIDNPPEKVIRRGDRVRYLPFSLLAS